MSNPIQALSVTGGRGRAASVRIAELGVEFAIALRRGVPFLARRRIKITAAVPRCVSFADLALDRSIVHASAFSVRSASAPSTGLRGLLLIEEVALGRILDGVLGGEGVSTIGRGTLTLAENALASRVSRAMLRAFGDVLTTRLKLTVEATPVKEIQSGAAVLVTLELDGGGRVHVAIPLASIATDEPVVEVEKIDSGIARAMTEVELDVVAELGNVRLPLETIANLRVGDVVRLALPLDERARVRAGGVVLWSGRPTASGETVAVALERRTG